MRTASLLENEFELKRVSELLDKLNLQMKESHQQNLQGDKEIKTLLGANRKALNQIRENLSYVEANL